jgi:Flp pilus assembly pilin Flp
MVPMSLKKKLRQLRSQVRGAVFVEYLLLLTLVGLGVIVGLSTLQNALINELNDLANAINAINVGP